MSGDREISPELEELKEAIEDSNSAQRRRHTENIHIIFASAVVGSFFTQPFQDFISSQGLEYITDIFVSLSVVYIILKLSEITLRDSFQPYGSSVVFGLLSPIIYIVAVFGYLLVVFPEITGVSKYLTPSTAVLITVVLIVISIPSALNEFKKYIDIWRYSIDNSNDSGERFEKLLNKVPSLIEDGLTITIEQPTIRTDDAQLRLDYIGEDAEGNTVLIEAKTGDIFVDRAQYTINLLNNAKKSGRFNIDRVIIAYPGSIPDESRNIFDKEEIELVQVDPYSAYGIFGYLFKMIDSYQGNKLQN
jgi:hypothetical protein